MAGKKEYFFPSLEISPQVKGFLSGVPTVVVATTTPHKVSRAKEFLKELSGYNGEIICLAAPSEPQNWQRPEEIAQEKVKQVAALPECPLSSLVIGTDCTICVNGDPSPLGKPYGDEGDVYEQLLETVGPKSSGIAEIRIGVAVFLPEDNRGVFCRIYYPFSFLPLTAEEVKSYQKRHGGNVKKRAGGCDFAGEFARIIESIAGTPRNSNDFSCLLADLKNAALGFPGREVGETLKALAIRNGGKDPWLRVYPQNPLFKNR